LDILINNAGIQTAKRLEDCEEEDWRSVIDVNLNGTIAMTHAAMGFLVSPGGVIVNVSSALAQAGCPGFSTYSASKAGLDGFTQSLAWELAPKGIRVVGVAPGLVNTPMTRYYSEHLTLEGWEQLQACHPLGVASPHDVAAPIAFLASREAQWITGITLPLGFAPHLRLPIEPLLDAAARDSSVRSLR
jgi:NAD(P)-dependent dehydrogenase (short-subunit alcohol dehydrogenase family)